MILAVDIGNSSISFGVFDGAELRQTFAYPTAELSSISHPISLIEVLKTLPSLSTVAIASVVPEATEVLKKVLTSTFPSATLLLIRNSNIPLINEYSNPDQVGTDRLLGALAAYRYYSSTENKSAIVIDFGTATTYDCVTAKGEYLGGIIALGVASSIKALSTMAAQLPEVPAQFPSTVLGRSTEESIQSGTLYGALASLEGLVQRLTREVFRDEKPIVVATGGFALLFREKTALIDEFDPHLILRGILIAAISL